MSLPTRERISGPKILIAVDFGTTFSGVAWAFTGEDGAQNIIQNWPDTHHTDADWHGMTTDKVPTTLVYGHKGRYKWGYQTQDEEGQHEWFKLGLDPSMKREKSSLARRYLGDKALPLQMSSFTPQKLVTDYLSALLRHVENMLVETVREAALRRTLREYIITVPAIWSESARDLTITCAADAGMGDREKLHVISEPEAAALYAFKEMNSCGLKEEDTFMVCDAGGGTVDLISYTIRSLQHPLQISEAASGSGSACGSIFLNRIFAQTLNEKFADDPEWESDKGILAEALERFDTVTKVSFNGKKGEYVPVPGLADRPGIRKGKLFLSAEELRTVFEPVISEILELIENQRQETKGKVKLILLVGGFGSNFYLRSRIRERFKNVEVKVAPYCQTAVVRGALMKGLEDAKGVSSSLPRVRVNTRRARKHYGTESLAPYQERTVDNPAGHSPERKQQDPFTGEYHVPYMKWFLRKGERLKESEPSTFEFVKSQPVSQGRPKEIRIDIYFDMDRENQGAPKYKTPDVQKLGTVTANISDLDPEFFTIERGKDGQNHYVLEFDIEMRCLAAKIEFTPIYGRKRFPPAQMSYT